MKNTKKLIEKRVLYKMSLHFSNRRKAYEWYCNPHHWFGSYSNPKGLSPKWMVNNGEGFEVLKLISDCSYLQEL